MLKYGFMGALVSLVCWFGIADAQYVIVLKNGRQITVENYREEGSMIKFSGLGGEIAISKDQIQTIRPGTASASGRTPSLSTESPPAQNPPAFKPAPSGPSQAHAPAVAVEEDRAKKRAQEAKVYEDKLKNLTQQLKELRERYALLTRGNVGPEPSFFTTEEQFKGQQDDLLSRLRDAQNRAKGLPTGSAVTSPQFALNPPPAYTPKQKELSDLRSRMNQIENERQAIIEEMRAKGFEVGSLFLE